MDLVLELATIQVELHASTDDHPAPDPTRRTQLTLLAEEVIAQLGALGPSAPP